MLREPPDILITTPESLFLLLTSRARELLRSVDTLILDEVHAVAGTKRGAHLALSVERLEALAAQPPQRIGLSATQRPLEEIGRFVSGGRPIELVDAGVAKELDLEVVVPVEDMREPGGRAARGGLRSARSIWPSIYPALVELVRAHRSTIVFVNNRRLAERLALRLNELAEEEIARAHHGSLAREQRTQIEEDLKAGRIPCLVATSSLELGIDMGAVDLVIQVESPKSVARGLQRIGRAGHSLGEVSKRAHLPEVPRRPARVGGRRAADAGGRDRGDADPAQPARRPRAADRRDLRRRGGRGRRAARARPPRVSLRGPLARAARERPRHARGPLPVGRVRRAAAAHHLGSHAGVCAAATGRAAARRHERGHDPRPRPLRRVHRRRRRPRGRARRGDGLRGARGPGDHARRLVVADRGDHPRPRARLAGAGRARARCRSGRARASAGRTSSARRSASSRASCSRRATRRCRISTSGRDAEPVAFLREQEKATGALPSDRTVVVERFRDEIGDWRLCILTPFGARVHAPWAMAVGARLRESLGLEVQSIWSDDGIAFHLPDADSPPATDLLMLDPDELEELVLAEVGQTALFGARFRENAARALLIPRRRPGERTPLWQQRLKAQGLLQVARKYSSFPIVLETYRECLQDVFDLPALKRLLGRLRARELDLVDVETATASPVRVLAPLRLHRDLHVRGRHAAGGAACAGALARPRPAARAARPGGAARADRPGRARRGGGVAAAVPARIRNGSTTCCACAATCASGEFDEAHAAILEARAARDPRPHRRRGAARSRWRMRAAIATRSASCRRRGCRPCSSSRCRTRCARSSRAGRAGAGRSRPPRRSTWFGVDVEEQLRELEREEKLVRGELRPGGTEREWCDPDVLRRLRRASLAALRREVEPVEQAALGRFLPSWHGDRPPRVAARGAHPAAGARAARGAVGGGGAAAARARLPAGAARPALRVRRARVGRSRARPRGGLLPRGRAAARASRRARRSPEGEAHDAIRAALAGGALFWDGLLGATELDAETALPALWDLVWSRRGDERLLAAAARRAALPAAAARPPRAPLLPRTRAAPDRDAGTLVARGAALRRRRARPARARGAPARAARHRHARRRPRRGDSRRLQRGLRRAAGARDARLVPARLLRRGSRRRAVRARRRRRAAARAAAARGETSRSRSCSRAADPAQPYGAVAAVAEARRAAARPAGPVVLRRRGVVERAVLAPRAARAASRCASSPNAAVRLARVERFARTAGSTRLGVGTARSDLRLVGTSASGLRVQSVSQCEAACPPRRTWASARRRIEAQCCAAAVSATSVRTSSRTGSSRARGAAVPPR